MCPRRRSRGGRCAIASQAEQPNATQGRESTPAARACAGWFRQLARALKTCRLYRGGNSLVNGVRDSTTGLLLQNLRQSGGWHLRFRPDEILLGGERVVSGSSPSRDAAVASPETRLPFVFYRDGIRGLRIQPGLTKDEADEFFDALVLGCNEKTKTDDLVTLLWQANLNNVAVEAAPIEQTFYLSDDTSVGHDELTRDAGPQVSNGVSGTEVRATLGQASGVQGLHLDTFDDWEVPPAGVDVREAWARLSQVADASRRELLDEWAREKDGDWDACVPALFEGLVENDPWDDTRSAFASATATWLTSMLEQHHLARAAKALQLLDRLDPGRGFAAEVLDRGLEQLAVGELAEYLDDADPAEHGRFAALMVGIGTPGIRIAYDVMALASRNRVRAAAATALCYLCADDPAPLERFLDDPRADAVLNLVFVLGQIGGAAAAPLLRRASMHGDSRVRRQAVLSLGGVPQAERTPVLLDELARLDPHILSATLAMLARQQDENVTRFILGLIKDPEFAARGEDVQRALFGALTEVANDGAVQVLEGILNRGGGLFARRTFTQFAAALTLRRLGTAAAGAALERGLKSRNATVRGACEDAVNAKAA